MRALLLSAGFGTRLQPLTNLVPKCLVKIGNKHLLDYWLDNLLGSGLFEGVVINTHYLSDLVIRHCQNSKWSKQIQLIHETELLGTAGTLRRYFDDHIVEDIFVAHADNISLFYPSEFVACFKARDPKVWMTMMTFNTDTPQSCGIVDLDQYGNVTGYYEKVKNPPGNLANAAVFLISKEGVEKFLHLKGCNDLCKDVVPYFIGHINTYQNHLYHRDIGTLESLNIANTEVPGLLKKV